jgi:hypothetical protein
VAKAERVTHDLAERMHMGYRGMTSEDHTRHTRFAAALCLHQLIEGDSPDEDEAWRQPKGILTAGVLACPPRLGTCLLLLYRMWLPGEVLKETPGC